MPRYKSNAKMKKKKHKHAQNKTEEKPYTLFLLKPSKCFNTVRRRLIKLLNI